MRFLARFAMRGPSQAIGLTLVAGALSWLILPAVCVSGAIVALIGMQLGSRPALQVSGAASVLLVALGFLAAGGFGLALNIGVALAIWIPAALLGVLVNRRAALMPALMASVALGVAVCAAFFVWHGDPTQWWASQLHAYFHAAGVGSSQSGSATGKLTKAMAASMSGVTGALLFLALAASLLLGRWWQGELYRPGAFGEEFRALRFGQVTAVVFFGLLVGGLAGVSLAGNFGIVLRALFLLQGLAVVHALVKIYEVQGIWLGVFYAVLLILSPLNLVLAIFGALDNWLDFRGRARRAR
ncbi:MAG TPA: hypothetical protein VFA86_07880 [Gammaproteobacteria bacterium]|nr:hypothetical protein [Gammaproteobacteria bacterium]